MRAIGGARLLARVAALAVCINGVARGQVDTVRPRPSGASTGRRVSDWVASRDIELVEVVHSRGFDPIGATRRRGMLDTLEIQRRIWEERRPRAYLIRLVVVNDCIYVNTRARIGGEPVRDRIVVRDTTIVGREPAPLPRRYENSCPRNGRVDDLFADVASALADTTVRISSVQFDPAYGFPRSYFVVRGTSRGDQVMVESFAPTPPT